ncbi:hypothetical protein GCM10020331_000310 [Ectobacillus funiculus]
MEKAQEVAREIEGNGGELQKAFQADVSSRDSLTQVAHEIEQWSGGWDILLNAPGKKIVRHLSLSSKWKNGMTSWM